VLISLRSTRVLLLPVTFAAAAALTSCTTEPLVTAAPSGVNLSGEWKLNLNLSDDPTKPAAPDTDQSRNPGFREHHNRGGMGRGGGGGMPPIGTPPEGVSNLTPDSGMRLIRTAYTPDAPSSPAPSDEPNSAARQGATAPPGAAERRGPRPLQAADRLSIVQQGATVTIRTNMPDGTTISVDYTAGTHSTVPYGTDNTADRTVGWRGPIFVVTTKPKSGGMVEDNYAIDDDGRLILSTFAKGGRMGKVELKWVYDRLRN